MIFNRNTSFIFKDLNIKLGDSLKSVKKLVTPLKKEDLFYF